MTFGQRLPYYLVGLFMGILVVVFVLGKKNTTFDYGPNARVLKNIRSKELIFDEAVIQTLNNSDYDTAIVSQLLREGKADMWNKERLDSCIRYEIRGRKEISNILLTVKNCDSLAFIEALHLD